MCIRMSYTELSPQTLSAELQALVLWELTHQHIKIVPRGVRKQSDLLLVRRKVTSGRHRLATELQKRLLEGTLKRP